MKSCYCYLLALLLATACSGNGRSVKNVFRGKLVATKQLVETGEKRFRLDTDTKVKPPVRTVEELMNLLMSLGIIQKNTDERINMPEIYLHGFGLRRKGGLRRPK